MKRALTYASALAIAAATTVAPAIAQSKSQADEPVQSQSKAQVGGAMSQSTGAEQAHASEPASVQAAAQQAGNKQSTGQGQPQKTAGQADKLIATVDDDEIRQSDVMAMIETLPAGVQQTPPQMLLPAVVDQLIMRRLIADEARAQGLENDPEVKNLVVSTDESAIDQALVAVWLKREIDKRVTDEDAQAAVDKLKANDPDVTDDTPGLQQQVRQALQVQAMTEIGNELQAYADITFYGPDGKPVDATEQVGSGTEGDSQAQTKKMQSQTETQSQN